MTRIRTTPTTLSRLFLGLLLTGACAAPAAAQAGRSARAGRSAQAGGPEAAAPAALDLVPRPRELTPLAAMPLRSGVHVVAPAAPEDEFALDDLQAALRERGIRVSTRAMPGAVRVAVHRADAPAGREVLRRAGLAFTAPMTDEGYVLVAERGRADVVAATAAGVFYGVQTLKQLVTGSGDAAVLHGARVRDWPAMRWRGLHDDLSRGPVPTLDFQKKQIRTFAAYKMNVYSPYFEHTLEYPSHPVIAPPGGAMTPAQVKELVAYAKRYHVTVVPEQEAFGHLHHVLTNELYAPLGETPHGHVLAPGDSGSIALIADMFTYIDSMFPGPFMHIGADETFELGRGRTREAVEEQGLGPVYLGFLKRIADRLRPLGKRLLFWGDVAMNEPDLVGTLPADLIAVPWAYGTADSYDRYIEPFRNAGLETWAAPGVSDWNRVWPDFAVALPNIQGFARDAQRLGSVGLLNTTWDDDGEALFNGTWYAVLFGAAAAWQPGVADTVAFQHAYGRVFHGDATGAIDSAQLRLKAAHRLLLDAHVGDASDYLFWLDPWSEDGRRVTERILPVADSLRLLAERALVDVDRARHEPRLRETDAIDALELGARRVDFIGMKFQLADEIVTDYAAALDSLAAGNRSGAARYLGDISGINGKMQDVRDGYSLLRDEYEAAWLRENRPYWLHNVLARYDLATQRWLERIDRFEAARQEWYRSRTLPSGESIGIP